MLFHKKTLYLFVNEMHTSYQRWVKLFMKNKAEFLQTVWQDSLDVFNRVSIPYQFLYLEKEHV